MVEEPERSLGRWLPYALVGVSLPVGLAVVLFEPLPWPVGNLAVGGLALAVTIGSVHHLVVRHAGPGERGPDF